MNLDEAQRTMRSAIAEWIDRALAWDCDAATSPPGQVLRVTVGAGKTQAMIEALAAHPTIAEAHAGIYVPSHRLAEEIAIRLGRLGGSARVLVYKGRSAPGMCSRPESARRLAAQGYTRIGRLLCRDDRGRECPDYHTCLYRKQIKDLEPAIRVMPHAYLTAHGPPPCRLRVIDEAFHGALLPSRIRPRALDLPLSHSAVGTGEVRRITAILISEAQRGLRAGEGLLSLAALRAHGLTWQHAARARFHWEGVQAEQEAAINPSMSEHVQLRILDEAEAKEAGFYARLWSALEVELRLDRPWSNAVELLHNARWGDSRILEAIAVSRARPLRQPRIPTLLMDATTEPLVYQHLLPYLPDPIAIDVPFGPRVYVRQVHDTSFAKGTAYRATARRETEFETIIRNEWGMNGQRRGLVITYKGLVEKLRARFPMIGDMCDLAWFNAISGIDTWGNVPWILVAGRLQPTRQDVERITRQLFWDRSEGLIEPRTPRWSKTGDPVQGGYEATPHVLAPRQGPPVTAQGWSHPHPAAAAVLRLVRDAELVQALGRARLCRRQDPVRVTVLCDLAIPGVQPDRLVAYSHLLNKTAQLAGAGVDLDRPAAVLAAENPLIYRSVEMAKRQLRDWRRGEGSKSK